MGGKVEKMNLGNSLQSLSLKLAAPFMAAFLMAGCNDSKPAEKVGCVYDDGEYSQVGDISDAGNCEGMLLVKRLEYADSGVIARLDAYMSSNQSVDVTWAQIAGPEAVIVNPSDLNADVLVPYVQSNHTLVFEVTVNDGQSTYTGRQTVVALPLDDSIEVETPVVGVDATSIKVRMKNIANGTPIGIDVAGGTAREDVDYIIYRTGEGPWTVQDEVLEVPVDVLPCSEVRVPNLYTTLDLNLPDGKIARINVVIDRCGNIPTSSSVSSSSTGTIIPSSPSSVSSISSVSSVPSSLSSSSVNIVNEKYQDACQGIMPTGVNYPARVENPYLNADLYADPDYQAQVTMAQSEVNDDELRAAMEIVKAQSTAVWIMDIEKPCGYSATGKLSFIEHIEHALAGQGEGPLTMTLTISNIPGREYGSFASGPGDFDITDQGALGYQTFIDSLAAIMASTPRLRFALLLEPHVLAGLADQVVKRANSRTPLEVEPYEAFHKDNLAYALWRFSQVSNVYAYLDVSNSDWVDSDDKEVALIAIADEILGLANELPNSGNVQFSGFIANTLNYMAYEEPFVSELYLNRVTRISTLSVAHYIEQLRLIAEDYPSLPTGFVVDSSRNGWGAPNRPTEVGDTSAFLLDKRGDKSFRCNINTAGLGVMPQADPDPDRDYMHAFFWFKPPGESDGDDNMLCVNPNSLENPPSAGEWFDEHFIQLIEYSWPRLLSTFESFDS